MAYLDKLGDPRTKLRVDTHHMNVEESDLFFPLIDVGDRLGYVHIGENRGRNKMRAVDTIGL